MDAQEDAEIKTYQQYKYPTMSKTIGNFKLTVMKGEFTDSQIVVMLGENGTGKTTFIRMLVHLFPPFPPPPLSHSYVKNDINAWMLFYLDLSTIIQFWNKYGWCLVLSLPHSSASFLILLKIQIINIESE